MTAICLQNWVPSPSFLPFLLPSLPTLLGPYPLNPVEHLGERCVLPSGFAKRLIVDFELKIMPLVTRNEQSTTLFVSQLKLWIDYKQISKSSMRITDDLVILVKYWCPTIRLRDTSWSNLMSGHQDNAESPPMINYGKIINWPLMLIQFVIIIIKYKYPYVYFKFCIRKYVIVNYKLHLRIKNKIIE